MSGSKPSGSDDVCESKARSGERYTSMKVHVSDNQKDKIKKAVEDNTTLSIRFKYEDLNGQDILAFTKARLEQITNAYKIKKGVTIKMSKTQVQYNKKVEGGFLGPLLAGVASAVLPNIASFLWDKITGRGIYLKRGNSVIKVKHFGDGLYLRPYKDGFPANSGEGLFLKTGNGFEQIKDASISDVPIYKYLE